MVRRMFLVLAALVLGGWMVVPISAQEATEAGKEKETPPPPGKIGFYAENSVAKANGTFHKWSFGQAKFDPDNLKDSMVTVVVDVSSIDTGIEKRDNHLRNEDFFHVEKFPTATLKIYEFKATKKVDEYTAKIDFFMHGEQKTYDDFAFKVIGQDPIKVEGKFTFNRMDFKVGAPKSINPMSITEEIPITFSATLP